MDALAFGWMLLLGGFTLFVALIVMIVRLWAISIEPCDDKTIELKLSQLMRRVPEGWTLEFVCFSLFHFSGTRPCLKVRVFYVSKDVWRGRVKPKPVYTYYLHPETYQLMEQTVLPWDQMAAYDYDLG